MSKISLREEREKDAGDDNKVMAGWLGKVPCKLVRAPTDWSLLHFWGSSSQVVMVLSMSLVELSSFDCLSVSFLRLEFSRS